MIHRKKIPVILGIFAMGIGLVLSGCTAGVNPGQENEIAEKGDGGDYIPISSTRADLDTAWEEAVEIDLSLTDREYTITDAGDYLLSGSLEGNLYVDAEEQIVHLIFNHVDIRSRSGPAIHVKSAGKVIITLADGSSNTVQDSMYHRGKDEGDAAIYSQCDLTVNGTGSLTVYGDYADGIHSKDVVKLLGGDISVRAKNNAVQGNDGLLVNVASLAVECEGSGLRSTKSGKEDKGTIDISGGQISIIAGEYAVSSARDLYMRNCSFWSNAVLGELNAAGDRYLAEGCMENG